MARERATACRTLISLLQGIEGYHTTIELRNENSVTGTIEAVDGFMNINLSNAIFHTLDGRSTHFSHFFVRGINVRFVHIPDEVDMLKTIEKRVKLEDRSMNVDGNRLRKKNPRGLLPGQKRKDVLKARIEEKNQEMIRKLKEVEAQMQKGKVDS